MARGVCLIAPGGDGGIQTYTRLIQDELAGRGRAAPWLDSRGPDAWRSPRRAAAAGLQLARLARAGQVETVHLMASERLSLARKGGLLLLARALGLRAILHHHGAELAPWGRGLDPVRRSGLARMARAADLHLVLGADWARFLAEDLGVDPARIRLLRNALPDRPVPARPRPPGAPLRVLFLAVMTRRKGARLLVEALARLKAEGVAVEAVFAGEGPERAAARREAARAGLLADFPGRVEAEEAARLMAWADVLAHPSDHEGLPMTILEALRAALPVVAVPAGAIAESLPEGAGLRRMPAGDAPALASALADLARDPAARAALGAAGRRAFEARFCIGDHVDALENLYGWPPSGAAPSLAHDAAVS
ncbi:MAG: glycosyltransferase family 4 protein [Pseudomonadota bacterium]